jgi:hypothetical protein
VEQAQRESSAEEVFERRLDGFAPRIDREAPEPDESPAVEVEERDAATPLGDEPLGGQRSENDRSARRRVRVAGSATGERQKDDEEGRPPHPR